MKRRADAVAPIGNDPISVLSNALTGAGPAESVCPNSAPLRDVATFQGARKFSKFKIRKLQQSTVRLSLKSAQEIQTILDEKFGIKNFRLGVFASFMHNQQGFCSGTLVERNIVVTAGHCVSPGYWFHEQQSLPPYVVGPQGQFVRYLTSRELSNLIKADFNEQLHIVVSNGHYSSDVHPERFSEPITEWISSQYQLSEPDVYNGQRSVVSDFAILRVRSVRPELKEYALGLSKLSYSRPSSNAAVAIIQHPEGGDKKVSTGRVLQASRDRLYYREASTSGGSSGAGILNSNGKMIGIHTHGGCSDPLLSFTNQGTAMRQLKSTFEDLTQW